MRSSCAAGLRVVAGLLLALPAVAAEREARVSTYTVPEAPEYLLQGATVLTGTGERIEGTNVLFEEGVITGVGDYLSPPSYVERIDAYDLWVTPGLIDVHALLHDYRKPDEDARGASGAMEPATEQHPAEDLVWPEAPGFARARGDGVTTLHVRPDAVESRSDGGVTLKNVPAASVAAMKFPGAPHDVEPSSGEGAVDSACSDEEMLALCELGRAVRAGERLNVAAAQAMRVALDAGVAVKESDAIRWITADAADALGIGDRTGRLEEGYAADVVLWDRNPFSDDARPLKVWIDGALRYEIDGP
ncbi:MAG: amidohydrolase family protein [Pseudomonadales bacterium]|nr:amidohydrolase family protein [Pseudomonadales bacterium]